MLSSKQYRLLKKIQCSFGYNPKDRTDRYFLYFQKMHYLCLKREGICSSYVVSPEGETALEEYEREHFYQRLSMLVSIGALIVSIVALMQ